MSFFPQDFFFAPVFTAVYWLVFKSGQTCMLHAGGIPALASAAHGMGSGLGTVLHGGPLAQLPDMARSALIKLGIPGLEAGFGCGVGIGYGYGVGIMLRPSALQSICTHAQRAAGAHRGRWRGGRGGGAGCILW